MVLSMGVVGKEIKAEMNLGCFDLRLKFNLVEFEYML